MLFLLIAVERSESSIIFWYGFRLFSSRTTPALLPLDKISSKSFSLKIFIFKSYAYLITSYSKQRMFEFVF